MALGAMSEASCQGAKSEMVLRRSRVESCPIAVFRNILKSPLRKRKARRESWGASDSLWGNDLIMWELMSYPTRAYQGLGVLQDVELAGGKSVDELENFGSETLPFPCSYGGCDIFHSNLSGFCPKHRMWRHCWKLGRVWQTAPWPVVGCSWLPTPEQLQC